jgi:hypothetical protein
MADDMLPAYHDLSYKYSRYFAECCYTRMIEEALAREAHMLVTKSHSST